MGEITKEGIERVEKYTARHNVLLAVLRTTPRISCFGETEEEVREDLDKLWNALKFDEKRWVEAIFQSCPCHVEHHPNCPGPNLIFHPFIPEHLS